MINKKKFLKINFCLLFFSGHRFKTTHDFGFVALDVLYVYTEDSGEYVARAVNDYGEDTTRTTLRCKGIMQNHASKMLADLIFQSSFYLFAFLF